MARDDVAATRKLRAGTDPSAPGGQRFLFRDLLRRSSAGQRLPPNVVQSARFWYRNAAQAVRTVDENRLMARAGEEHRLVDVTSSSIGRMFCFFYDPRWKQKLPYYDTFPLVFLLSVTDTHLTGLNIHYLPPALRAQLMDALWTTANNDRMDEQTKLRVSYGVLKAATKFRLFRPCFKQYRRDHVRSRFLYITPHEWDAALMLPLARFKKASPQRVYADSRRIADGKPPHRTMTKPATRPRAKTAVIESVRPIKQPVTGDDSE